MTANETHTQGEADQLREDEAAGQQESAPCAKAQTSQVSQDVHVQAEGEGTEIPGCIGVDQHESKDARVHSPDVEIFSSFQRMQLSRPPSVKEIPPPLPLYFDREHSAPSLPLPLSSSMNPDPSLGPSDAMLRRLLRWELEHPLDEGGKALLTVKKSSFPGGGLGCFADARPAPVEYIRDISGPREGFLTQEESDSQWAAKAEGSTYIMEVTLGADWFRDEVEEGGKLRPMQMLHRYVWQGRMSQRLRWDNDSSQYVFEDKSDRALYKGLLQHESNPAPFMNDALFGQCDGDSDEYEESDERVNAFTMVPCLRRSATDPDKVELSSVWYYPRVAWAWGPGPQEVTCGYHWPLEPWMEQEGAEDVGMPPALRPGSGAG